MPFLKNFKRGDRVFVAENVNDWLGVEVGASLRDTGSVKVTVVWTNELPGYEIGQKVVLAAEILAHRELTVDAVIGASRGPDGAESNLS